MKRMLKVIACALALTIITPVHNAVASGDFLKEIGKGVTEIGKDVLNGVLNGNDNQRSSSAPSSKPRVRKDDGRLKAVSNIEGLNIKVKNCYTDENDNVIIIFILENLNDYNATCDFRPDDSEAYDDEGNIYQGSKYIKYAPVNESFGQYHEAKLPSGVPTKYKMKIANVDPAATVLKQVKIYLYELPIGSMTGSLYLKNVPIQREGDE